MPEWVKVIIEGVVEGITEFLPISSTGHLIISSDLLQMDSASGVFEIFIQLGAVIAVIVFYREAIWRQVREVSQNQQIQEFWLAIVVAFIPAALLGFLFGDMIDKFLFNPTVVAISLIVGGIMFLLVERFVKIPPDKVESIEEQAPSLKQALIIGCWQVLALIPGMSRSGMTMLGAMFTGLGRKQATEFSFYLAIPTLGAATIYTLLKNLSSLSSNDLAMLFLGMLVSGIVAWVSIAWLLRFVATHSFVPFGYYRIIVGIFLLILIFIS